LDFRDHSMNNFREESVHKVDTGLSTLVYILTYGAMIFFGIIGLMFLTALMQGFLNAFNAIGLAVSGGLCFGCYVLRNNQRIEYDYTFTNGVLDIAKVINNSKRKKLLSADIREFETIAPISDEGFNRMLNHPGIKKLNYFLNRGGLYYGVFTKDGAKTLLVFEPSDEMIAMFKKFNPRNVKER
jgi:hypothetical protein